MCLRLSKLLMALSRVLRAPSVSPLPAAWPYARSHTFALPANFRHMALITCCASSSCRLRLRSVWKKQGSGT